MPVVIIYVAVGASAFMPASYWLRREAPPNLITRRFGFTISSRFNAYRLLKFVYPIAMPNNDAETKIK